jgi:sulfonate dioxygenase
LTLPPLGDIPFTDRGHFADAKKANLYAEAAGQGGSVKHYTPVLGVEFKGVSLKQLSKQALDDLALLIAERGVVGKSLRLGLPVMAANSLSTDSIQEAR